MNVWDVAWIEFWWPFCSTGKKERGQRLQCQIKFWILVFSDCSKAEQADLDVLNHASMKIWPEITRLELSYLTRSRADDCCKSCRKAIAMLKNRLRNPGKERVHNSLRDWESNPIRRTPDPIRSTTAICKATFPCIMLSRTQSIAWYHKSETELTICQLVSLLSESFK